MRAGAVNAAVVVGPPVGRTGWPAPRRGGLWIHLGGEQGVPGTHSLDHHLPRRIVVLEPSPIRASAADRP